MKDLHKEDEQILNLVQVKFKFTTRNSKLDFESKFSRYGGGVTFLSGKAYERLQVTGLDLLFYPDLRRFYFRGIFLLIWQIRFFIRISSRKKSLFYPDLNSK